MRDEDKLPGDWRERVEILAELAQLVRVTAEDMATRRPAGPAPIKVWRNGERLGPYCIHRDCPGNGTSEPRPSGTSRLDRRE